MLQLTTVKWLGNYLGLTRQRSAGSACGFIAVPFQGPFPLQVTGGGGHAAANSGLLYPRLPPSYAMDEVHGGAGSFVL